jgi:hypothetical protein
MRAIARAIVLGLVAIFIVSVILLASECLW